MAENNPYAPPSSSDDGFVPRPGGAFDDQVPDSILQPLRQTRPWVRFLGILGFISCGLLVVAAFGITAFSRGRIAPAQGLVYIPVALLGLYPSLVLYQYGRAIGRLLFLRTQGALHDALVHQKSLWRFAGISSLVMLVIYGVAIVAVLIPRMLR